jgi:hypothetical protein
MKCREGCGRNRPWNIKRFCPGIFPHGRGGKNPYYLKSLSREVAFHATVAFLKTV